MINLFPYTDAHELNLDWVVEQVKANNTKVKDLTHTVENLHFDFDSKADKANTYTKSEVDTLLLTKADATEFNNYYNKGETDSLLSGKADISDIPDMDDYYNKTETDALLNDKANVSDLPDMSDYYDKTTIDAWLEAHNADFLQFFQNNTYVDTSNVVMKRSGDTRVINLVVDLLSPSTNEIKIGNFAGLNFPASGYWSGAVCTPTNTSLIGGWVLSGANLYIKLNTTSYTRISLTLVLIY